MSLAKAAKNGTLLEILTELRDELIQSMAEASAGVKPQYAKQISDLSREIAELEPAKKEATDIDSFREEFASLVGRIEDPGGEPSG
ncbi:hypothetical protein [Nocardia terpenica]|uniref:Uncharacterized protein n=1 Tax=Nocardia terpenica TaxID=455432 RepID=A0A164HFG7_9NOCA|nr:hypothetical protein [Nocardia terpenica]KZM68467.1 hypothetical protein AWN90_11390 [Nocardia terpenica]NQE88583.1 hypothetical protein [Nocardia terpenica]